MNKSTSIFALCIIAHFVLIMTSCSKDKTKDNVIQIQDTLTNLSLQDYNIALTDRTTPTTFESKLFVMYPSKANNSTSTIDVNIVIDLPLTFSSGCIIANGSINLKAKDGFNLFTVSNPSNPDYQGEVLELNSIITSEPSERGYKPLFWLNSSTFIGNNDYEKVGNSLVKMVLDLNSVVDDNLGFTLSIINVAGEEKIIARADEINWLDYKKVILKGKMNCKLALTGVFDSTFEEGDYPLSVILYGEGCGYNGKYKSYLFKRGNAITLHPTQ